MLLVSRQEEQNRLEALAAQYSRMRREAEKGREAEGTFWQTQNQSLSEFKERKDIEAERLEKQEKAAKAAADAAAKEKAAKV
jgi:hypothetical protein